MALMVNKIDFFVTADQNLMYQINLRHALIPVFVLRAKSNRYDDLKPLIPLVVRKIDSLQFNKVNIVSES